MERPACEHGGIRALEAAATVPERVLVSLPTHNKVKAMGWRLWWWQKVRRANIPRELRERFEFYGERLVTLAIESGGSIGTELADLGQHKRSEIVAWLQERRDLIAQQEDRQETVEWHS